jgi:hypothetical protein
MKFDFDKVKELFTEYGFKVLMAIGVIIIGLFATNLC